VHKACAPQALSILQHVHVCIAVVQCLLRYTSFTDANGALHDSTAGFVFISATAATVSQRCI
jgi:hypothetical protein